MAILLLAEHDNVTVSELTARALTAASQIGGDIDILVAGKGAQGAADAAAKLAGVRKVLLVESDALENQMAEPLADLIVSLEGGYDVFVAAATTTGKNVFPRVAALLDVMQVSEIVEVVSPDTFKRPIYAGNAIQTVKSSDAKKVITVRTSGFVPAGGGAGAPVEAVAAVADRGLSAFLENRIAKS
ncbi:MAG: electron transfer flavoprotein subunit beta, partial [Devosia sp.]|nr:electron transfer flavoprotein subunit beta [Devosia sp.]